eukprot:292690-Rhodomonas_salina.1
METACQQRRIRESSRLPKEADKGHSMSACQHAEPEESPRSEPRPERERHEPEPSRLKGRAKDSVKVGDRNTDARNGSGRE